MLDNNYATVSIEVVENGVEVHHSSADRSHLGKKFVFNKKEEFISHMGEWFALIEKRPEPTISIDMQMYKDG